MVVQSAIINWLLLLSTIPCLLKKISFKDSKLVTHVIIKSHSLAKEHGLSNDSTPLLSKLFNFVMGFYYIP